MQIFDKVVTGKSIILDGNASDTIGSDGQVLSALRPQKKNTIQEVPPLREGMQIFVKLVTG
eukprot:5690626-Karenia_brevis.AAC.1